MLKEIYTGSTSSSFSPRQFKATIGRHAPSFSGYGQQDSQEFLLFLLDGLQEDLNRIHKKPYIEKPDSTDEMVGNKEALREMADKCWEIYKARNDSVITDLFAGMYKSTLVCPVCDKVSIIFDPFNNLTLQLPIENLWSRDVFVFPLYDRPLRIAVDIDRNATFFNLKEHIAKKIGTDPKRLVCAEIYKSRFFKVYDDKLPLGEERMQAADDVGIFEVETVPTNYPPPESKTKYRASLLYADDENRLAAENDPALAERLLVPVFHRVGKDGSARFQSKTVFGTPAMIMLDRREACDFESIYRKLLVKVQTMTTMELGEGSDVDDSDGVMMTADDADSSTDSKVQASSIQSEDGMVDVSMREAGEETPSAAPYISYPPQTAKAFKSPRAVSKMVQRGLPTPDNLRKLFNVSVLHTDEFVPTGWHALQDESKKLQSLAALASEREKKVRRAQRARQRQAGKSRQQADGDSRSSSEDDADDPPPAVGKSTSSNPLGSTSSVDDERGSKPAFSKFSCKPLSDRSGPILIARTGQRRSSSTDELQSSQDTVDPRNDDNDGEATQAQDQTSFPLLELGDALVLEWDGPTRESLFSSGLLTTDDMRGTLTSTDIPLLPDQALEQRRVTRRARQQNGVSLDECLDEFGKPEVLSENDAWYCPRCKEHRRASKTFELWKAPDILVIHLKRFSSQGRFRDKLDLNVEFPIDGLDLTDRIAVPEPGKEYVYDLIAVDNHYGGLGGGHYTAFARNFIDDHWYEYNGKSQLSHWSIGQVVC